MDTSKVLRRVFIGPTEADGSLRKRSPVDFGSKDPVLLAFVVGPEFVIMGPIVALVDSSNLLAGALITLSGLIIIGLAIRFLRRPIDWGIPDFDEEERVAKADRWFRLWWWTLWLGLGGGIAVIAYFTDTEGAGALGVLAYTGIGLLVSGVIIGAFYGMHALGMAQLRRRLAARGEHFDSIYPKKKGWFSGLNTWS